MTQRQVRSTPDALRYVPGVAVQQTAHSQASAYIRGLTGQRTILLFDGIRLNNSLFRQGPNQYFFTVDSRSIRALEVTRGASSTLYGSDAIAGAINALPQLANPQAPPNLSPTLGLHSGLELFHATADTSTGGRLWGHLSLHDLLAIRLGLGARDVNQLQSGGPILSPRDAQPPQVPRFAPDGRTQLGTGFDEWTGDARLTLNLAKDKSLTLAHYTYNQSQAPRTDQCPPAYAPFDECLSYDAQDRTLTYVTLQGRWGPWAVASKLSFSRQSQHERRRYDRPGAQALNQGQDDLTAYGFSWHAKTLPITPLRLSLRYGADVWTDRVTSSASTTLFNLQQTFPASRGQYLSGSSYSSRGLWSQLHLRLFDTLNLRAGGRLSHVQANAPPDPASGSQGVDQTWSPRAANAGLEWWASQWLTLTLSQDGAFRAPNLDDLTSRQRTGPGFQIENPALSPERAATTEIGARIAQNTLEFQAWVYRTVLDQAIVRTSRDLDACPPNTPGCTTTWARLQLVNLTAPALILGTEASLLLRLPHHLGLRATASLIHGDGPTPPVRARTRTPSDTSRTPLSRIPPAQGTLEVLWRATLAEGPYLGGALRWARLQDRLSLGDQSDERIPLGGTPGFAVVDLRGGWRFDLQSGVYIVFENVLDSAYRVHGSSVNGPARGLSAEAQFGF